MFFAHLDWSRRSLIIGALAGVVLELSLVGAFLASHWLPEVGLTPSVHRTIELLPFVLVGGSAFVIGIAAFGVALWLAIKPRRPARGQSRGRKRPALVPPIVSGSAPRGRRWPQAGGGG